MSAQAIIDKDSLVKLIIPLNTDSLFKKEAFNKTDQTFFELSNTSLGLVIYEGRNQPFNLQIIGQKWIDESDGFESYTWTIDSVINSSTKHTYFCSDSVAWGNMYVEMEFIHLDSLDGLVELRKTYYEPIGDSVFIRLRKSKFLLKYKQGGSYLILWEPNRKSPDSPIKFLPIDPKNLSLYKR